MLHLEQLETRCLLSIVVVDSIPDFQDAIMEFDPTGLGRESGAELLIVTHDDELSAVEVSLSLEGDSFLLDPAAPLTFTLGPSGSETDFMLLEVRFAPQELGAIEEIVVVQNTADVEDKVDVSLLGVGLAGDLTVNSVTFPESVFPELAKSGAPLSVRVEVDNIGEGSILAPTPISFFLSTDGVLDKSDQLLSPASPADAPFMLDPIPAGELAAFDARVEIPGVSDGSYTILAVVDPDNLVVEDDDENNMLASAPLALDPYGTVVWDSVDEQFDRLIPFGDGPLAAQSQTQHVTVLNRGATPITITDWGVTGEDFVVFSTNEAGNSSDDVLLQPGELERIFIAFVPQSFGPQGQPNLTDALVLHTSDNREVATQLTGTVVGGQLGIEENSGTAPNDDALDVGNVPVGQARQETFTIINTGSGALVITGVDMEKGNLSPFDIIPAFTGTTQLGPAETLVITVELTPEATGDVFDRLLINNSVAVNDGLRILEVSGTGVAPSLTVLESLDVPNDDVLNFGNQEAGVPLAPAPITLVNDGTDTLVIDDVILEAGAANAFVLVNDLEGPLAIEPGESFLLEVGCVTPESAGQFDGTLTILHSGDESRVLILAGISGVAEFEIVLSDNTIVTDSKIVMDTIAAGKTSLELLILRNSGVVPLRLDSISVEDNIFEAGAGFFGTDPLGGETVVLDQGESIKMALTFVSTAQLDSGQFSGQLLIEGNANKEVLLEVLIVAPEIGFSGGTGLDFGTAQVGSITSEQLEIINSGTADLIITGWAISDQQFQVQGLIDSTLVIAPNESAFVEIRYLPSEVRTEFDPATTLSLITNDLDAGDSLIDIALSAQSPGIPLALLEGTTYGFFDGDGDFVRVSIANGSGLIFLENGQGSGADINTLEILGSGPDTKVRISVEGGNTTLGNLVADGPLRAVRGPKVNIDRSIDIDGSLQQLTLNDLHAGAKVNLAGASDKPMKIRLNRIGENVDIDLAGSRVKLFQAGAYASGKITAKEFATVKITQGNMGATLVAEEMVKNVQVKSGTLTGTLRAREFNAINVRAMNGAMVSAADLIKSVNVKRDIIDSNVWSGYDIGLDGIAGSADDQLTAGNITRFRYGGLFDNTHVAVGVRPIHSDLLPPPSGPVSSGSGFLKSAHGKTVITDPDGPLFGFFYADNININLTEKDNFLIQRVDA